MRTLYVSDLDGTLLRSDERTSGYTNRTVNRLVGEGMLFSYATARSFQTARKVTAGLEAEILSRMTICTKLLRRIEEASGEEEIAHYNGLIALFFER